MDPRQAADAAALLEAAEAVPIHYDTLHNPPTYAQVDRPSAAFADAAAARGLHARLVAPGENIEPRDA